MGYLVRNFNVEALGKQSSVIQKGVTESFTLPPRALNGYQDFCSYRGLTQ